MIQRSVGVMYSDPQLDWTSSKRQIASAKRGCVMDGKPVKPVRMQRWTANRKREIVLKILKSHKIIMDVASEHDLKQNKVQ